VSKNNYLQYKMPIETNSSLPFDVTTMLMLAIAGVLAKLFLSGGITSDGSTGPASITVWGYGLTSMAFIGLLLVVFALSSQVALKQSSIQGIKTMVQSSFPVVATLIVLGWIIVINMSYMKRINMGKVAPEFSQFSFFSSILIILQLLVVIKYILDTLNIDLIPNAHPTVKTMEKVLASELTSITMVLTLLNLIFAGMMQVVVEFFSTDG